MTGIGRRGHDRESNEPDGKEPSALRSTFYFVLQIEVFQQGFGVC